jgi:hypothetical protein
VYVGCCNTCIYFGEKTALSEGALLRYKIQLSEKKNIWASFEEYAVIKVLHL